MSETPVCAVATIRRSLSPHTYWISLPNGKEIVGHLAHDLREEPPVFDPGELVGVEMTPYDFSKARITGRIGNV